MNLVWILLRNSPRLLFLAVTVGLLGGASSAGLFYIINSVLGEEDNRLSSWILISAFGVICVIVSLSRIASAYFLVRLGQKTVFDLRLQLSRQLLAAPLRRLEELGTHRLLVALTTDIGSVATLFFQLPALIINGAIVIGCLVYLGWLSWKLLLLILAFMFIGILTYRAPAIIGERYQRESREHADILYKHFRALTEGNKELKMHAHRSQDLLTNLKAVGRSFQRVNVSSTTLFTVGSSWGHLMFFVAIGILLFFFVERDVASVPMATGFCLILIYMMTPLQVLLDTIPSLFQANIAINKVESIGLSLQRPSTADDERVLQQVPSEWSHLQLAGVTYTYKEKEENESFTVGPADLEFRPGEVVFLVGGNGSGKTSLAKLLIGLYVPDEGEIRLDGELITDQNLHTFRQLFSVVFADFFLFDELLGLKRPSLDSEARSYLVELQLENKVSIENGAFSTTDLSHGQRKRLALLTAYLEDRPIYLFDEWAADQDPSFKEVFYHILLPDLKARNKTVIAITHDNRYYQVADRIIRLDQGKVESDERVSLGRSGKTSSLNGNLALERMES